MGADNKLNVPSESDLVEVLHLDLYNECIDQINALPTLKVRTCRSRQKKKRDAVGRVILHSPCGSREYVYLQKLKTTTKTIGVIINQLKELPVEPNQSRVLFTEYLSEPVIEKLIEYEVEFVDSVGDIYLNSPAAYILIVGKPPPERSKDSQAAFSVSGLKLIYCILKSPQMLQTTVREMADVAGISIGSVSRVLQNLKYKGYLLQQRDHNPTIDSYDRLLKRWQLGYAERLRPKLFLGSYKLTGECQFTDFQDILITQAKQHGLLIGGELGAAMVTDYLRPISATVYAPSNYRKLAIDLKLKPSTDGEVSFMRPFGSQIAWHLKKDLPLVDPLLIQAEILLNHNERLQEVSRRLYAETIADRALEHA